MTEIRVAIISHKGYKDFSFMQNQLNRLASLYHHVVVIHGGETVRYGMFLTQWMKDHPENFSEIVCERDVFKYGYGPAGQEQALQMLEAEPDEVWKFETSKDSSHRPSEPFFTEFWYMAAHQGITLRVFRKPFRKSVWTGKPYKEAESDESGFPRPVRVREWDAERNGVYGVKDNVQKYSNNPNAHKQRERRRQNRDYGNFPKV